MSIKIQGNIVIDDSQNVTANSITAANNIIAGSTNLLNFAQAAFAKANTATGTITTYTETTVTPTITSNVLTIDLSLGTTFNIAFNSNVNTINVINPGAAGYTSAGIIVFNYNGTAYTINYPSSFRFPSGIAPTLTYTNGKRDILTIFTTDAGTSYNAVMSAQNV
jgi:hypothetical protein